MVKANNNNMEYKNEAEDIKDHIDKLVIAARTHQTPSPETKELLGKLDKNLSLLNQKVEFIQSTLEKGFDTNKKAIEELEKRVKTLESLKNKIIPFATGVGIVMSLLFQWVKNKLF